MKFKIIVPIIICTLTAGAAYIGFSMRTALPAEVIAPTARKNARVSVVYGPPTVKEAHVSGDYMSAIAQGSSGVVVAESADGTSFLWEIFDSGFSSVGNSDAPNGWDVTGRSNDNCTTHVPVVAAITTNYLVVWEGDTGDYYGHFDVIAGGANGNRGGAGSVVMLRRQGGR